MAARSPVFELNVRLVPGLTGKLPVAPGANNTLHVVSVDSSSRATFVALVAVPVTSPVTSPVTLRVTSPVKSPTKLVDVVTPVANTSPSGLIVTPVPTCKVLLRVETPVILRFLPVI